KALLLTPVFALISSTIVCYSFLQVGYLLGLRANSFDDPLAMLGPHPWLEAIPLALGFARHQLDPSLYLAGALALFWGLRAVRSQARTSKPQTPKSPKPEVH